MTGESPCRGLIWRAIWLATRLATRVATDLATRQETAWATPDDLNVPLPPGHLDEVRRQRDPTDDDKGWWSHVYD